MYLLRRPRPGSAGPSAASHPSPPWQRWPIRAQGAALLPKAGAGIRLRAGSDAGALAHVVPFVENERPQAALVVAAGERGLFVDGEQPLRLSVLGERSEISLRGERLYFTAREPLRVELWRGDPDECALCGEPLDGARVIVCTGCGAATHEGALPDGGERLCFSHHGRCPRCHLTRGDFAWTPEDD